MWVAEFSDKLNSNMGAFYRHKLFLKISDVIDRDFKQEDAAPWKTRRPAGKSPFKGSQG